ncbi:TetR family transcriptional regulator C-terminal domain-containing protein [Leifsonia shinshuensis]|uniref:TetR/AcrR family transcriptional regulator n=1 Tax=Leifsonia shinshuensis TaxID=150026 RepID=UPI001F50DAE3|nr:TetR family transcriptional regulator C-terminal domain-containing protein [Leifsonia shinshuensis]MCI0159270.1 TetR family transcriptional regulator C-terminal domain-containing protein [Leifsonia shinshuensis]
MSRAARKPPAERRAELAAAARAVALDEGLAAVTLRAVAARAGVTPALVAHYHESMDGLVAETFVSVVAAELDELRALLAAEPDPVSRLAGLVGTLLDGSRDDVTVIWVEAYALGRRNPELGSAVRDQMDAWSDVIEGVIESGVASGDFRTDDPRAAAWQLLGMIDGLNAQALVRWGGAAERGSLLAHALEGMLGLGRGVLLAG